MPFSITRSFVPRIAVPLWRAILLVSAATTDLLVAGFYGGSLGLVFRRFGPTTAFPVGNSIFSRLARSISFWPSASPYSSGPTNIFTLQTSNSFALCYSFATIQAV